MSCILQACFPFSVVSEGQWASLPATFSVQPVGRSLDYRAWSANGQCINISTDEFVTATYCMTTFESLISRAGPRGQKSISRYLERFWRCPGVCVCEHIAFSRKHINSSTHVRHVAPTAERFAVRCKYGKEMNTVRKCYTIWTDMPPSPNPI